MNELLTPTVSVVLPVYNRLRYLSATIEGVLAQTMVDWELIVVDDGSVEDVVGFVKNYPDQRIRCVRQCNQGNAAARNTGLRQAQGEFIICLDSDDVWKPEMLATCCAALQTEPSIDIVFTQAQLVDAGGKPLPSPSVTETLSGDLLEPLLFGFPILPSSAVVRRRCFEQWGEYAPGLDDWELWLRWAARGCRFGCIKQPLIDYRIHDLNFNRDWPHRRQIHFAILDTFYGADNVPPTALALKTQAYAQQHFEFSVKAWELGRASDGISEFAQAVKLHNKMFSDADSLFRLAYAHQGSPYAAIRRGFSLDQAEEALLQPIEALRSSSSVTKENLAEYNQLYALACVVLARLAYGVARDNQRARHWIVRGGLAWPPVMYKSDWAKWAWRTIVNPRYLRRLLHNHDAAKSSL